MSTHRAIAAIAEGSIDEIQLPTGAPGAGEVLLKHSYAAMIAYDTYQADLGYAVDSYPLVLGINASGIVVDVGAGVTDITAGDRVVAATFHTPLARALQEYSIQPHYLIAKIPHELPLDQAATIPDNFVTAFYTIFNQLGFPIPDFPAKLDPPPQASVPILVYGAGATSGQFAIQLLYAAGYTNIITTASQKHHDYLRSLGASSVFDYRSPTLVEDIAKAAGGDGKVQYAIDSITSQGTIATIAKVISPSGTVALLLPIKEGSSVRGAPGAQMLWELPDAWNVLPKGTKRVGVRTFLYAQDEFLKENLMSKILPRLLELQLVKPNKIRLLDQGSFKERVAAGLDLLRNNRVSGEKVIVKIDP